AERGDALVIRGRSTDEEFGDPRMSITSGVSGMKDCTLNPAVREPAFEFVCPLNDYDGVFQFYVNLRGIKGDTKGSYFSTWDSQIFSGSAPPKGWAAHGDGVVGRAQFEALVLASINELRRNKGLRPMELAREQMEHAGDLYERYKVMREASDVGVRARAERIKRSIWMGTWIGEDLQEFVWLESHDINLDPAAYIKRQLATPLFREEILDPAMTHAAILTYRRGGRADVALVGYARNRERHHSWRVNKVLKALNKARAGYGLEPIRWYRDLNATSEELNEKVAKGKLDEDEVYERWSQTCVSEFSGGVTTYFYSTYDLGELWSFGELERLKGSPRVGIYVAQYRLDETPLFVHRVFITVPMRDKDFFKREELERVK
ncbi:MAG: hypothetical protein AAGI01_07925, partial [Myxococcota bacterium]